MPAAAAPTIATISPLSISKLDRQPGSGCGDVGGPLGPIIGTALEGLPDGRGTVVALIHLGWKPPAEGADLVELRRANLVLDCSFKR